MASAWVPRRVHRRQGMGEVGDQVVRVLDADAEPDEAVGDPGPRPQPGRDAGAGGGGGGGGERAATRPSACSMPMLSRMRPSVTPIRARSPAGTPEWVVDAGWLASDSVPPRLPPLSN